MGGNIGDAIESEIGFCREIRIETMPRSPTDRPTPDAAGTSAPTFDLSARPAV